MKYVSACLFGATDEHSIQHGRYIPPPHVSATKERASERVSKETLHCRAFHAWWWPLEAGKQMWTVLWFFTGSASCFACLGLLENALRIPLNRLGFFFFFLTMLPINPIFSFPVHTFFFIVWNVFLFFLDLLVLLLVWALNCVCKRARERLQNRIFSFLKSNSHCVIVTAGFISSDNDETSQVSVWTVEWFYCTPPQHIWNTKKKKKKN